MSHYECPSCGKVYGCVCYREVPAFDTPEPWSNARMKKFFAKMRKDNRAKERKRIENDSIELIAKDLRRIYRNRRDDTSAAARKDPFLLEIARRLEKLK